MADGSVTIKVDLDGKGAQSGVGKLKSLLGGLSNTGTKVGSVFKSVLGANLISSALTTGIRTIGSGIRSMATELNGSAKAWKTFEGNLQAFGRSTSEIRAAKKEMQDFAAKTIYSASDMANTYSQLDAVGTKNVGRLVKGFGGLAAAAENPTQAMKTLSTQATQMAAKPMVQWMDFKLMMEQTPAGIAAVAKEMGMSTGELVKAVQDGKVKTEDFFAAIEKAGNSKSFQKMATEFKTVDQAIDGMREGLSNKLQPAFEKVNQFGIKAFQSLAKELDKINFDKFANGLGKALGNIDIEGVISSISSFISRTVSKIQEFWNAFSNTGAVSAFVNAVQSISGAISHVWESLTSSGAIDIIASTFGVVVKVVSQAASAIANFIKAIPQGAIQGIVASLAGLIVGFKAFNFLKSFNPFGLFKRNADEAIDGVTNGVRRSKSTIAQVFNGLSNVIKSIGTSFKSTLQGLGSMFSGLGKTLEGFGKGVGAALKGLMQGLKGLNPVTLLSFGGAVAIAAVGIGAGIAIISAGFALLATQSQGIVEILHAVGDVVVSVGTAIGTILNLALQGLAQALVIVAPVLPTIAASLALLAPLVTAAGDAIAAIIGAFSSLAPVITALGDAISQIITALSNGIATIAEAVTPIVQIISDAFVQVVQIVSDAIVQMVQALAPFMPAITEMVQAVAPVLSQIVDAFNNLISQISPIINSIANLFKTLGQQISSVLKSASGVIKSFGGAVRNILDGVAGIFESMGNAAKNAGTGVKLMAQGIKMLVDLKLGDLVATLASTAKGLSAIANSGIASAGPGLQQAGTGLRLIATSAQVASAAMQTLPSSFSALNTSIGTFPSALATAGNAMRTFATATMTSLAGLSGSTAGISLLQSRMTSLSSSMMMARASISAMTSGFSGVIGVVGSLGGVLGSIPARFTSITASATTTRTAIAQLATVAPTVISSFTSIQSAAQASMSGLRSAVQSSMSQAVSVMRSSMSRMTSVVRSSASQMTQAGQQAGRGVSTGVTNGIRSGIGPAKSAMSSMVSAIRSVAMSGAGAMRGIGAMIGQGLAAGMYSALGSVTAAANALVAQANRAAQAKAKIHSPSRLFRDEVGRYIAQGIAVGIEQNSSDVVDSLAYVQREMSAFKFGVEDLLGTGNATLSSQFKLKTAAENAQASKVDVINEKANSLVKDALEVARKAVSRDTTFNVDGKQFARATADPVYREQQRAASRINRIEDIL